ncbi:MAG: 3-phosphoshikimate 1-carboxyvinyltransferase [Thiotrichales bacterium]|nr:3-phosphoshikimate 1-carboxyvinyltransferase [Thiotrichales bacterium]
MTDSAPVTCQVDPGGCLQGTIPVPGDKSISHRALMLAAICSGESHCSGFLPGEDTRATGRALQQMGVDIREISDTELLVQGVGLHGLSKPGAALDLGNSGTSTRLLSGLLSGAGIDCELIGDASLRQRPMGRVIEPLQQMGVDISGSDRQTLPINIKGGRQPHGIHYTLPVASAQLKSSLLLAGLYADTQTCIVQPAPSRDHTERMLTACGAELTVHDNRICIQPVKQLQPFDIHIPADISSAAFLMVGALICPGADVLLPGIGINPTRNAVLEILQAMGGRIELRNKGNVSGEPVADIHIVASELQGIDIPEQLVPNAIDEFPAIVIAAACAQGTTRFSGAAELRLKESDRIQAMAAGLEALGITVHSFDDGMQIEGGRFTGGEIDSFTDHRIAMAFAMAGLAASAPVVVRDCANIATSFPDFLSVVQGAGMPIRVLRS